MIAESMENVSIKNIKDCHFIGIGGIGISAIARMMLEEGKQVSGSDSSASIITEELEKLGATIHLGQKAENIPPQCDLVVYTIAVGADNPEFIEAKKRKISVLSYPEVLKLISREKYTIAISGTHGKTTTTAMVAKILIDAGLDPTVIVGSLLKDYQSNFISGKSDYFVVEACEYRRSFLNIEPKILVITNIDNDHLDYYKDIEEIEKAFSEMAAKLPKNGFLVCDMSDPRLAKVAKHAKCPVFDYLEMEDSLKLKVPGAHNIKNAKAALVVGGLVGVSQSNAKKSLEHFSGTWRRFEYKGKTKEGVIVYDDYGHHPTEIRATLQGAREEFPKSKIIVVFQPHLYSRTKSLLSDFGECFRDADVVLLAPIYSAREAFDASVSSKIVCAEIVKNKAKAFSFQNFEKIEEYLKINAKTGNVVITIGAGDIYKVGEYLLQK